MCVPVGISINKQQQENGTTADHWGDNYSSEQWEDQNALITADLRDFNGAA